MRYSSGPMWSVQFVACFILLIFLFVYNQVSLRKRSRVRANTLRTFRRVNMTEITGAEGEGRYFASLHGPSMFAVKAKIYGVLYHQAS